MTRILKLVLPLLVLGLGVLGAVAVVKSRPPVVVEEPAIVTPLVRVVQVEPQEIPLVVRSQGTVLPRVETQLAAQVTAQVVWVAPRFAVGEFLSAGEELVRLDARDFELAVESARAQVAQAGLRLAEEEAEARLAREELERLKTTGAPDPLLLREPQLREARAMLSAAEAELAKARLALERTTIRAPFAGRVRAKHVDQGQLVNAGEEIATLHAIDVAEIRLPVPDRDLAFLDPALTSGNPPARPLEALLSARFAGRDHEWPARIVRSEGELDSKSRMLYLTAHVEDPYRRKQRVAGGAQPSLPVGLFVDARIFGRVVPGSVVLPRSAWRGESQVLVVDHENRLRFREVSLVRIQDDLAIIDEGLAVGEQVCISPLEIAVDGQAVETLLADEPQVPIAWSRTSSAPSASSSSLEESREAAGRLGATEALAAVNAKPTGRLLGIRVTEVSEGRRIELLFQGTFRRKAFPLRSPPRFVIDLLGVVGEGSTTAAPELVGSPVEQIRVAQHRSSPEPVVRVVFDLREGATPSLQDAGDRLLVIF